MASVCEIKPEWHEAAQQVTALYKQQRQLSPVGKRSHLDDESALASIFAAIDAGLTPQQAGNSIGIHPNTITDFLAQAEQDEKQGLQSAHRLFGYACQRARDRRRQRLLQRIEAAGEAGPQFWTAPAWLLERGYGQDYKLQQDTGRGNVIVNVGIIASGDVKVGQVESESPITDGVIIPALPATP